MQSWTSTLHYGLSPMEEACKGGIGIQIRSAGVNGAFSVITATQEPYEPFSLATLQPFVTCSTLERSYIPSFPTLLLVPLPISTAAVHGLH